MEFAYPSPAGPQELRLLQPLSITRNSLHFKLTKHPRSAAPTYTAVSYTWGDGEASEFIYLDNQRFSVRPNLWSCLYYLGQDAKNGLRIKLWVDAICIDQNNTTERNSQVSRMDDTYRKAAHVSVWLGLPSIPDHVYIPPHLRAAKTHEIDPFDWFNHINDLANRPYWSRVWVIQECLLGENVLLYCGNTKMLWMRFQDILCSQAGIVEHEYDASFGTPGHATNSAIASFSALPLVMARHVDKHPELLQSLHDLLVGHHRAECKDPRDKIFGLLGLVTIEERALLERFFPDYNMSEDHVRIIALAHVVQYNVLHGAPEVTTRSNELFLGLGVGSVAERKRLLRRARLGTFDYFGCENSSEAEQFLTFSEPDDGWPVEEDDEDPEGAREVQSNRRRLWTAAGVILVITAVALVHSKGSALPCMRGRCLFPTR